METGLTRPRCTDFEVGLACIPTPSASSQVISAYLFKYYLSLLIELLRASKDQDHHIVIHRGVEKVKRLNRKHLELNGWNVTSKTY